VIGCYNGQFVAFECKAGKGKTTALQERELHNIQLAKGWAFVITELNVDHVEELLRLEKTRETD
jgi:penicillin-binding protein-related factor A (putative recombinase)